MAILLKKNRGITIFADQGLITYNDSTYYLIDTPGHVDFSPEMERSIQVMDYAVVIISAVDGVEGHTETIWQLLGKHHIPTFFFINKMDREGANTESVLEEIRSNLSEYFYHLTDSFNQGNMSEDLIEFIAERDESLLDVYMETGYDNEVWLKALKR